mgnify:CR=1 FL=1
MKAIWNNQIIAESEDIIKVEGNSYFPADSVKKDYLRESQTHTICPWKGTASYYDLEVDGKINKDAAWYYPEPREMAKGTEGRVAFWKGLKIEK